MTSKVGRWVTDPDTGVRYHEVREVEELPAWLQCGKHILSLTRRPGEKRDCGRPSGHVGACSPTPLDVDR